MDTIHDLRIYNESCPQLKDLLKQVRRQPAARLGASVMPLKERYSAGVWKRLFMIALTRLAAKQPSLARLTAVEALHIVGSSASPSRPYPRTTHARYLLSKLKQMETSSLRGRASPKKGFHPNDLHEWTRAAVRVFQNGLNQRDTAELWRQCSGGRSRMPKNLMLDLNQRRTPRSRAMAFVARLAGVDEDGLKVTLFRRKKARLSLQ